MIEPQNTTMPLPAAPASTGATHGDGMGFGAMLAQSLGMAVPVDPSVVPQIASGSQQQQQSGDGSSDLANDDRGRVPVIDGGSRPAPHARFATVASDAVVAEPATPASGASPVADDALVADLSQQPPAGAERDLSPVAPATVAPAAQMVPEVPRVGLGKSAPTATVTVTSAPVVPDSELAPRSDAIGPPPHAADPDLPVVASTDLPLDPTVEPSRNAAAPAAQPVGGLLAALADKSAATVSRTDAAKTPSLSPQPNPTAPATDVERSLPDRIDHGLVRPEAVEPATKPAPLAPSQDRTVPTNLTPTPDNATATMPAVTHVTWPAATPPRVDLDPQVPIRVDGPRTVVASVTSNADPVVLEPASSPAPAPVSVSPVDMALTQTTVTAESAGPASPTQYSALAERVMRAVEMQANQPPPRTMVVDIPEIEGLRLVVSVRGGAQVHVVPTTGSSTPDEFRPFMNELSGVLADRGFVMTGDGRERRNDPDNPEQQQVPFRLQRPTFRRPTPTDNDLRI